MIAHQHTFHLPAFPRGFHLITSLVVKEIPELKEVKKGLLHVFIQHTSAGLTLNENADPTVRKDFESHLNVLVPENVPYYKHNDEGPDDMPAHIKSSLMGSSVSIPVTDGRLTMGMWQGIYLTEHRNNAAGRTLTVTLMGV
jgi:secondary thiamine-phosphate synthase enzyme